MLGVVGLLLFFLPILSIPLGGVGLVFGFSGLVFALLNSWTSLRWSVAGIVLSGLALAVSLAIAQAPAGNLPVGPFRSTRSPLPIGRMFHLLHTQGACWTRVRPASTTDEIDAVRHRSQSVKP